MMTKKKFRSCAVCKTKVRNGLGSSLVQRVGDFRLRKYNMICKLHSEHQRVDQICLQEYSQCHDKNVNQFSQTEAAPIAWIFQHFGVRQIELVLF
jgi:hypothetical protein